MKTLYLFLILLGASSYALGDVYKYIDEHGNVTYSNTPSKGAKKVDLPPISVVPASTPPVTEAPDKTSDEAANKAAKQKMLEDELAKEQDALEKAKQALKAAEEHPHVFVKPSGGVGRNVAAYEESIRKAKEEIALHEKNIARIQSELAQLK